MINYTKADLIEIDEIIKCRLDFLCEDVGPQTSEYEATMKAQLQEYFKNHLNRDCFVFTAVEDGKIISIAFLLIIEKPANPSFLHGRNRYLQGLPWDFRKHLRHCQIQSDGTFWLC